MHVTADARVVAPKSESVQKDVLIEEADRYAHRCYNSNGRRSYVDIFRTSWDVQCAWNDADVNISREPHQKPSWGRYHLERVNEGGLHVASC